MLVRSPLFSKKKGLTGLAFAFFQFLTITVSMNFPDFEFLEIRYRFGR
jgi:hypothetical protein